MSGTQMMPWLGVTGLVRPTSRPFPRGMVLGIQLGVGLLLSPITAAAAMAPSSLSVVASSNRLRGYKSMGLAAKLDGTPAGPTRVEVRE